MARAYLGLGSNMGNRRGYLRAAVRALSSEGSIVVDSVSDVFESEPAGGVEQRNFYNLVVGIETPLSPHALLGACQRVERLLKRRRSIHWGPRVIDIDILLYDAVRISDESLVIPHPELLERPFFLVPLADIGPEVLLPSGNLAKAYKETADSGGLRRIGPLS